MSLCSESGRTSHPIPWTPADETSFSLSSESDHLKFLVNPSPPREVRYHLPEQAIAMGPAAIYETTFAAGSLLGSAGGINSCAMACIVFSMCRIVMEAVGDGNEQVIQDVKRIAGAYENEGWMPRALTIFVITHPIRFTWVW